MIQAIVTDIEGTTSEIAFVKKVLFPYARAALPEFVAANAAQPEIAAILDAARAEMHAPTAPIDDVVAQFIKWIDDDKKIKPLKALQGHIWRHGYETGELKGHMYADAVEQLNNWHTQGLQLYIYSSGSVLAQKLLFGYSNAGDLTGLFTDYFDLENIGPKDSVKSYNKIIAAIGLEPQEILFLSDIVVELDAASEAGMKTAYLHRSNHPVAYNFSQIQPQEATHDNRVKVSLTNGL